MRSKGRVSACQELELLERAEGALTEFVALIQAVEMGMEVRFNDPRFADVVTLADMVKAKR